MTLTQKQRVHYMLRDAGSYGVRSDLFLSVGIPRAAARVKELREEGLQITSEREEQFVRYILTAGVRTGVPSPQGSDGFADPLCASADSGDAPLGGLAPPASSGGPPVLFEIEAEPEPSTPSAYDPYRESEAA